MELVMRKLNLKEITDIYIEIFKFGSTIQIIDDKWVLIHKGRDWTGRWTSPGRWVLEDNWIHTYNRKR